MGRVSLPPPVCDSNFSQRVSFENNNNNNNVREASFSSYLNQAEREFVRKLAESTRDRSNSKEDQDGLDIEVFGAEKYFSSGIEIPNPIKLLPKQQQKTNNRYGTPSVGSEASWNSQNALLKNVNTNSSNSTKKKKSSQLVKSLLYKIYCCDKKSVEIGADIDEKSNPINFTFQSSIPESTLKMQIQVGDQQGRESIEVFRSSLNRKPPSVDNLNLNNLEKRLSLMAWNDVVPRVNDEDAGSDTSSDLFEIENLTGNLTDCVTPTGCYAPSEASIDWSVVTAAAADFSAVSDYDEWRLSTTSPITNISAATAYMIKSSYGRDVKEIPRPRSNHLMSSSVEVHWRVEAFERLARLESETKVMAFGSNYRLAASRNHNNY